MSYEVWRRRFWWWVLPAAFCVLNLLGFAVYRYAFAGQVERLKTRHDSQTARLLELREEKGRLQDFLDRVEHNRQGVDGLYRDRFSTEDERFTAVWLEVRRLAGEAGFRAKGFNYPREDLGPIGLVRRQINFQVTGTFEQLRTFINFLELSEYFLTLEGISLSDTSGDRRNPQLGISLKVSTVFTRESDQIRVQSEASEAAS